MHAWLGSLRKHVTFLANPYLPYLLLWLMAKASSFVCLDQTQQLLAGTHSEDVCEILFPGLLTQEVWEVQIRFRA